MKVGTATIRNKQGIHVRPSGVIISEFQSVKSRITLKSNDFEIPLASIMDLLALGLQHGDVLEIRAEGDDEDDALVAMIELFERVYDFPPRN